MTEILNIPITSDARELFVDHDIDTIRKIKDTALAEMDQKQNVLRQFIGDNYKPVLNTPPVLQEIKTIFSDANKTLNQITSFSHHNYQFADLNIQNKTTLYANVSQLYLKSITQLNSNEFNESVQSSIEASEKMKTDQQNNYIYTSLGIAVSSLPNRILTKIQNFLTDPKNPINSNILSDCYCAFSNLQKIIKTEFKDPIQFFQITLKSRIQKYVQGREYIIDTCLGFVHILSSLIEFVHSIKKGGVLILRSLVETFSKTDFTMHEEFQLEDVLKWSKTTQEAVQNQLKSSRIGPMLKELKIEVDFWQKAFLPVYKKLAEFSIYKSIKALNIEKEIDSILKDNPLQNFNAAEFALSNSYDLKTRSLGLNPTITALQQTIESSILNLTTQLQGQNPIAVEPKLLIPPLVEVLDNTTKKLETAVTETPLCVYQICDAILSPAVITLLSDTPSSTKAISNVHEKAAKEWARRRVSEASFLLEKIPQRGSAMNFLVRLERDVYAAGGRSAALKLAECVREEAKKSAAALITRKLERLDVASAARKASERAALAIFEDFCLLRRSLEISDKALRPLFIAKMDPATFAEDEKRITENVSSAFEKSGELIKMISGGKEIKPPSRSSMDVNARIDALFGNKL